jgi:hypothetical protein
MDKRRIPDWSEEADGRRRKRLNNVVAQNGMSPGLWRRRSDIALSTQLPSRTLRKTELPIPEDFTTNMKAVSTPSVPR